MGKRIYPFFSVRNSLVVVILLFAATAILLSGMGRIPICECGFIKLWHGVANSPETSQHLTDFYTFSHIIHGFIFYWLLKRFLPKAPIGLLLVLAILPEAGWELLENTSWVIDRYRTTTIALDYFGDSIINSVFDILAMCAGFMVASRVTFKVGIFLIVLMELFAGVLIRDNLTLNLIMLLYPVEAIKNWQMGV